MIRIATRIKAAVERFLTPKSSGRHQKAPEVTRKQMLGIGLRAIIVLAFCVLLISPLRSCVFTDLEYIGDYAAQRAAIAAAAVPEESVGSLRSDMILLDGRYCYRVDFTDGTQSFSYIIDAESGAVVASNAKPLG